MHHCQAFKSPLKLFFSDQMCFLLQTYGLQLKDSSAVEMCTFVRKVQEDSAAESAGLTAGEPPTSSAHVSHTHTQNRQTLWHASVEHKDRQICHLSTQTHPHIHTHTETDKHNAKSYLSSRNWWVPVSCILIYCRGHHHHYKRCQYWRIISSAHTWSDQRVNQQLEVSFRNDFSDNRDNLHRNIITQLWWSCR